MDGSDRATVRYTRPTVVWRNRRRCPGTVSGKESTRWSQGTARGGRWSRRVTAQIRVVESSATQLRLHEARAFVDSAPAAPRRARRRRVAWRRGRSRAVDRRFGPARPSALHRFSLTQLAARLARPILAADGLAPATPLGSEAVSARAAFEAQREGALSYFEPVARTPGFPARARANAAGAPARGRVPSHAARDAAARRPRSVGAAGAIRSAVRRGCCDRSARLSRRRDTSAPRRSAGAELSQTRRCCCSTFRSARASSSTSSRRSWKAEPRTRRRARECSSPFPSATFQRSIAAHTRTPSGPTSSSRRRRSSLDAQTMGSDSDRPSRRVASLPVRHSEPPEREPRGDVQLFSAPGEGREVDRDRAPDSSGGSGPAYRSTRWPSSFALPQRYVGLLEHALTRAGIPAWFDRGTRRPHPAGRAFVAILTCACEKLSARRFAEYLSLAQVPQLDDAQHSSPESSCRLTMCGRSRSRDRGRAIARRR